MPVVIYLSNQFPSPVEPYVTDEIEEIRRRGLDVLPCSARRVDLARFDNRLREFSSETLYLWRPRWSIISQAIWQAWRSSDKLKEFLRRILFEGGESPLRRARALVHTLLGLYLAILLEGHGVKHIHVHHGYFSAWVGMVAARILSIEFSLTLHGSDLLLHSTYLDVKLKQCKFCLTISEYNRREILRRYPFVDPDKVIVQRLGVNTQPLRPSFAEQSAAKDATLRPAGTAQLKPCPPTSTNGTDSCQFVILAVGRLHPVKDHAFLIRACHLLKEHAPDFLCLIAGEGPQRNRLEQLIRDLHLQEKVELLGHVPHPQLDSYYARADLVVLSSRSEGLPLTLMEAMARQKLVLAPAITGIPELIEEGDTGFLYSPGCRDEFVSKIVWIRSHQGQLERVRLAARRYVTEHFGRKRNLARFGDLFLSQLNSNQEIHYENSVLQ